MSTFHGPNHCFCGGAMDGPLAEAAWAGVLAAQGNKVEAEKWEASAIKKYGTIWLGTFDGDVKVEIRVIGGEMTPWLIDFIAKVIDIQRNRHPVAESPTVQPAEIPLDTNAEQPTAPSPAKETR